jgi:hypothetical protein
MTWGARSAAYSLAVRAFPTDPWLAPMSFAIFASADFPTLGNARSERNPTTAIPPASPPAPGRQLARLEVEPRYQWLNGHDPEAFIVSVNVARRNMSKGQQAMALAMIYPEDDGKGGRGKKGDTANLQESWGFSRICCSAFKAGHLRAGINLANLPMRTRSIGLVIQHGMRPWPVGCTTPARTSRRSANGSASSRHWSASTPRGTGLPAWPVARTASA